MNRTYVLRRAAAATVIGVTATVVSLAGASPAHAEADNSVCSEYRQMSNISWNQYFAETDKSWNTDILGAARMLGTARYWDDRVVDTCY